MNEREKMLHGELYDASDPALAEARFAARHLARQLNTLDPEDIEGRDRVLRRLLGEVGSGCWVEPPFHCDYGTQIRLGSRVYVNMGCIFLDAAPVTLGDDVQIGPGVQLLTSDHPRGARERTLGPESALPISIGARSWLGGGVIVLPGVEIGSDVVIGAGSVVTRSVPPGVTAAGNPCRVISGSPTSRGSRIGMSGLEARAIAERLLAGLDEAAEGASGPATYFVDNHPDSGLFGSLLAVDATDASRAVGGTSVAAHVHHVAFAMRASADWMAGDRTPRDWDASWQVSSVDAVAWSLLIERLRQEYRGLRAAIGSGAVAGEDAFGEAVGSIAHVAYHLGSIRQKLAVLREADGS